MFYSVIDTVRRYLNIWSSMNVCDQLTESLLNVHRTLGSRDRRSRAALDLLLQVDQHHSFSAETRQEIRCAYEGVTKVRGKPRWYHVVSNHPLTASSSRSLYCLSNSFTLPPPNRLYSGKQSVLT